MRSLPHSHTDKRRRGAPMSGMQAARAKRIDAMRRLLGALAERLDVDLAVRLWDGTLVPLGTAAGPHSPRLTIESEGAIASLLRRPTLERLIRLHAKGHIGYENGTLIDIGERLMFLRTRRRLKSLPKAAVLRALAPFLLAPGVAAGPTRAFEGDAAGSARDKSDNKAYSAFHYNVSNAFYELFLDPSMMYTCAYFTDWDNSLEQAQTDKMDMICRKLRLREGERFLEIGCGWGGLLIHAARNYGVRAHGIGLAGEQLDYARAKAARLGLADRITISEMDYADLPGTGTWDKIASVGMSETIGVANHPAYFRIVRSVLAPDGLFLNHAITRGSKRRKRKFGRRPEQRAIQRYIFPGGELADIGHTVQLMEQAGFEVHDVEGWREHYALTCRKWCEALAARRAEAEALVGEELVRIWLAYLAGVSLAFSRGTLRLFQTLVSRSAKGPSPVPPTRADLYR